MELNVMYEVGTVKGCDVQRYDYDCPLCGFRASFITVHPTWTCQTCGHKFDKLGNLPEVDKIMVDKMHQYFKEYPNTPWNPIASTLMAMASAYKSYKSVRKSNHYLNGLQKMTYDYMVGPFYKHLRDYFETEDPLGPNKANNLRNLVAMRIDKVLGILNYVSPGPSFTLTSKVSMNGGITTEGTHGEKIFELFVTITIGGGNIYKKTWCLKRELNGKAVRVKKEEFTVGKVYTRRG
jgi:ribosomal protein L37AE/L43A